MKRRKCALYFTVTVGGLFDVDEELLISSLKYESFNMLGLNYFAVCALKL
jgi:hypothetical protein